jgi:hypothetical protein
MPCNNANPETTPQPVVTTAPEQTLWQKVSPETTAQVAGGIGAKWN